jgi:hypothetical protein
MKRSGFGLAMIYTHALERGFSIRRSAATL